MESKTKQNLILVIVGVVLFAALMNFTVVLSFLGKIYNLVLPVIAGGILAMFINVPLMGFKRRLMYFFRKKKKSPPKQLIHIISFILTLICFAIAFTVVLKLLIPQIIESCMLLYNQILDRIEYIQGLNLNINIDWAVVEELISRVDINKMSANLSQGVDVVFSNVVGALSSTISVLVTATFAVILAIYMTLGKDLLCRNTKTFVKSFFPPVWAEHILHFTRMFSKTFAKFLSGQCLEAVILGVLMFITFSIFKLPYGVLVGVLTAFCAIIPYVGAFISGAVSVFLTLIIQPELALRCFIVYIVTQFVENQFIYPRVVGSQVGLAPLYTLIAAMIGGSLFGVIGIIFFIPLTSVILKTLKEEAVERTEKREKLERENKQIQEQKCEIVSQK